MIILGIDASTKATGWSIFNDKELIESGVITASSTDVIKRVYKMRDEIDNIMQKYDINVIVLEEVIPKGGPASNPSVWKALTKLQAALAFLWHDKYPKVQVEYILPNSWRSKIGIHTGRGATRDKLKQLDIKFVEEKFGKKCGDDEADAIGIGYSHIVSKIKESFAW